MELPAQSGVEVIRLDEYLCNSEYCKTCIENIFICRHAGHLSYEGSVHPTKIWIFLRRSRKEHYEFIRDRLFLVSGSLRKFIERSHLMVIEGKRINLRLAEIEDARFLLSLRLDPNKSRHLSKVDSDLEKQVKWLTDYKIRESLKSEYYFIIEDKQKNSFGCLRIYDFKGDSFCWGSWILKNNSPSFMAIESALQVYEFAFYTLKFNHCHFEVRKENASVIAFHERFGAKRVSEDDLHFYFTYSKSDYEKIKIKYGRFL